MQATLAMSNDDFPFMNDDEIRLYREAIGLPEEERSEEHNRAMRQKYNEADLLTLWELMVKLKEGVEVSPRLADRLELLYAVADKEGLDV